jgi:hypothetical protein
MLKQTLFILALLVIGLLVGGLAAAQGGYALDWWTVDGGGGSASGGIFALSGTMGQPDAGTVAGGEYMLEGGFWYGETVNGPVFNEKVYLPVTLK